MAEVPSGFTPRDFGLGVPQPPTSWFCSGTSNLHGTGEATVGLGPGYLVEPVGGTQGSWPPSGFGQAQAVGMSYWGMGQDRWADGEVTGALESLASLI